MARHSLSLALSILGFWPAASWSADTMIGEKVFLKPMARPRVGTSEIDPNSISLPATVENENDDWLWIGRAWVRRGEAMTPAEAIDYYSQQTRQRPSDAAAWSNLAAVRSATGDYAGAIKDISTAIRLDPRNADAYANRGWARGKLGDFENAIKDLNQAFRLDPQNGLAFGNSAWIRATSPDATYRDGVKAVLNANKACELSGFKDWNDLDTLAAAYAEKGDFDQAVRWASKAVELAPAGERSMPKMRLELYQAGKSFRDAPASAGSGAKEF